MSAREAIELCRLAHSTAGSRWPTPLLAFLDELPDKHHVPDWTCLCVRDLLNDFGKLDNELKDALKFARDRAAIESGVEDIRCRAWALWNRRSIEGSSYTSVAQLLFAICGSSSSPSRRLLFATPILLLEQENANDDEVFDRVLTHFSDYVESLSL